MFIELIDSLRCPNRHEDSWLVGAFDRLQEREVLTGRLGCPICRAQYEIVDGIVRFDPPVAAPVDDPHESEAAPGADDALRLAAMLDLASPGGLIVLAGEWTRIGVALAAFADSRLLLLNAPESVAESVARRSGLSAVICRGAIPVAPGSCRGIALGSGEETARLANSAVGALRAGGRLVAPVTVDVPEGIAELARDASLWVGARVAGPPPALVPLGGRSRRQ
ncbi:MAG TPA: hypothetical protein VMM18_08075 [Gemmatimonadaceae bacterium]|nr:hypothetical protein [Gemmatimonadaceae bacterium]